MSLFAKPEKRAVNGLLTESQILYAQRRGYGYGGTTVSTERADQHMAVWRCKHLLADLISGLPYEQFRQQGKDRKMMTAAEFVRQPSDLIDAEDWRAAMVLSALDGGNGYAYVTRFGADGLPRRAEVVPPDEMNVKQPGGFLSPPAYSIGTKEVDSARVLHLRAFGPKPGTVLGMSPIRAMAPTVQLGLAVRDFGSSWYSGGGHPTTLLSTTEEITGDMASAAKEQFRDATTSDHIAVVGNGWDIKTVQQHPSDALFLAATNATTVDICGYYGVPPEFLGYANAGAGSVTYANREQRILDLLTMTVGWWVGRIERLFTRNIPQPQFVRGDVDALLRSDAMTRWNIHKIATQVGAESPNDIRREEHMDPRTDPQGDAYIIALPGHLDEVMPGQPVPASTGGAP